MKKRKSVFLVSRSKRVNFNTVTLSGQKRATKKYNELYERDNSDFKATQALNKRLKLLKTNTGKSKYLKTIVEESEKRSGPIRNISRKIGTKLEKKPQRKRSISLIAHLGSEVARKFEGQKPALVSRAVDKHARWALSNLPTKTTKTRLKIIKPKKRTTQQKLNQRYFSRLFSSEKYSNLGAQEKINLLNNLLQKERLPTTEQLIKKEINKQKNIILKNTASKTKLNTNKIADLIRLANNEKNPFLRKKLILKTKNILKKQNFPVPVELDYILKYPNLTKFELERVKEFEIAKNKGDYISAAKSLKGVKFKVDEAYKYAKDLRKNSPVKAGLFFIELGFEIEAERIAMNLERKGDKRSIISAMNLRKRLN